MIELTATETATWEDNGPEGDAFRRATRERARELGGHVEIYSADGIVLDAIDSPISVQS